jgi:hypothetical protein
VPFGVVFEQLPYIIRALRSTWARMASLQCKEILPRSSPRSPFAVDGKHPPATPSTCTAPHECEYSAAVGLSSLACHTAAVAHFASLAGGG